MVVKTREERSSPGKFSASVLYTSCQGQNIFTEVDAASVLLNKSTLQTVDNALYVVQKRLERRVARYNREGHHDSAKLLQRELDKVRAKATDNGNGAFRLEKFEVSDITCESHTASRGIGLCPISTYSMHDVTSIPYIQSLTQLQTATGVSIPSYNDLIAIAQGVAAKAIAGSIPYESRAELGTALLEIIPANRLSKADFELPREVGVQLREAFKSKLPRTTKIKKILGAAGSEYLNIVFGWVPTLGDVEDALLAARDSSKLLLDFNDRFGKHYRFRQNLIDETQTFSRRIRGTQFPTYAHLQYGDATKMTISGTVRTRVWSSGTWKILPLGPEDMSSKLREWISQADYLYGIGPDPEMIWEGTPFSWLVDWQSNVGDVLKNASYIGKDGLVLPYAYSMMSVEIDAIASCGFLGNRPVQARFRGSRKIRIRGNPYGFQITPESFTPKQWSILAALGLTSAFGKL